MKKFFVFVFLIILFCCQNPSKKDVDANNEDPSVLLMRRNKKITRNDSIVLIGKEINSIRNILNIDTIKELKTYNKLVILYFSGYDCSDCIGRALDLVTSISQRGFNIYVIFSDESFGNIKYKYDFAGYLYFDHDYLLTNSLNLTVTPIFLKLDKRMNVLGVYHPRFYYDVNDSVFFDFVKK